MDRIETHPLKRQPVYGQNGMIAASQPLAAQAGLDILKKGGNAVDAAIATAACLTVVEPTSCGIGGDAFALVWSGGKLYGLNSSGPAPLNISIDKLTEKGYAKIPSYGWCPVTVPGVPGAWAELSKRFGKLSLPEDYIRAIVSHGWGLCSDVKPEEKMEKILFTIDELTGLITAAALMRPSKSVMDLEVKSIKKKWKDKRFAAGVDREVIAKGTELLDMDLNFIIDETIKGMRKVAEEIGLKGNL
jgi:hypothetical protein